MASYFVAAEVHDPNCIWHSPSSAGFTTAPHDYIRYVQNEIDIRTYGGDRELNWVGDIFEGEGRQRVSEQPKNTSPHLFEVVWLISLVSIRA